MAELIVKDLYKRFADVTAVDGINFTVNDGEFVTLLGPSGCGKSTTLAAVAGLEKADGGSIQVGGEVFYDEDRGIHLQPESRNCGLVFQSYALWPHMTVYDNMAFPLKLRKWPKTKQKERIHEVLSLVEMQDYASRYPYQLSGGQQQRVALARTLVYSPALLLLDEPLSNLDAKLRERARTWLSHLQSQLNLTTLYVTHDQLEALALSDRIAVMRDGQIVQLDTPEEIYNHPADPFVADFIGTSNFFRGTVNNKSANGTLTVRLGDGQELTVHPMRAVDAEGTITIAVRPERIRIVPPGGQAPSGEGNLLQAKVVDRSYMGASYNYLLEVGEMLVRVDTPDNITETQVSTWVPREGVVVFKAEPPAASQQRAV